MEAQVLDELKVLTEKVTRIQKELSLLSAQFTDHMNSCHGRDIRNVKHELMSPVEEFESKEIDAKVKYQEQSTGHSKIPEITVSKTQSARKSRAFEQDVTSLSTRNAAFPSDQGAKIDRPTLRRSFKEGKQECLRKSIRQNIVLLVDSLPQTESDILDILIETECLTETECSDLRNTGNRRDCVRNLVRLIKGRSYKVLKTFVECVGKLHPEVASTIWQTYEKLMKEKKYYIRQCTYCELKISVDIKFVADHFWSIDAISDDLYDDIVTGKNNSNALWASLAEGCNKASKGYRQNAIKKLTQALTNKGHYQELVLKLSRVSFLKCTCKESDTSMNLSSTIESLQMLNIEEAEDFSTVSPNSTYTSENEVSIGSDDNFPTNELENYFLSPKTAERDRGLYNSCFGVRKGGAPICFVREFRNLRSNSFGKNSSPEEHVHVSSRRRASMFM